RVDTARCPVVHRVVQKRCDPIDLCSSKTLPETSHRQNPLQITPLWRDDEKRSATADRLEDLPSNDSPVLEASPLVYAAHHYSNVRPPHGRKSLLPRYATVNDHSMR